MSTDLQNTAVSAYSATKDISSLQDGLAAEIEAIQNATREKHKRADSLQAAMDALKAELGVDSLTDPSAKAMLKAAEDKAAGMDVDLEIDSEGDAVRAAAASRAAAIGARKEAAASAHASEVASLEDEIRRLEAEKARVDETVAELRVQTERLDDAFMEMANEQARERRMARDRIEEMGRLHEQLDAMSKLMAVMGPYNKELEAELDSLRALLASG